MHSVSGFHPGHHFDGLRSSGQNSSPAAHHSSALPVQSHHRENNVEQSDLSRSQVVSSASSISSQFRQSNEASIEIVTQDGDRVVLSYSAILQTSSSESLSQDMQHSEYVAQFKSASSVELQFKVEGELDDSEQQAIDNLIKDIASIAGQFFSGDVQAAFHSAGELGFDGSELKSLAVDLQQNTQAKYVEKYQQTEKLMSPLSAISSQQSANPVASNPRPAIDVVSQLEQLLNQVDESLPMENPQDIVKDLLNDIFDNLNEAFEFPVKDYIKDLIGQR